MPQTAGTADHRAANIQTEKCRNVTMRLNINNIIQWNNTQSSASGATPSWYEQRVTHNAGAAAMNLTLTLTGPGEHIIVINVQPNFGNACSGRHMEKNSP